MSPNWKDDDPNNFARVRDQRLSAVREASRHLQSAVGIPPGTKMIGEASVLLWQMPEPPTQTTTQMFESLKAKIGLVGSRRGKAANSKPTKTADTQDQAQRRSSLASKKDRPQPGFLVRPALPPPSWISNPNTVGTKHVPAYWSHPLSNNIGRWLEHPNTKSLQIPLHRLDLRGLVREGKSVAATFIDIDPECFAKVKLSRLSIPVSVAQKDPGLAVPLEWLVIEVDNKRNRDPDSDLDSTASDESDVIPLPLGVTPHWVIAFPLQAITATRVEYEEIKNRSAQKVVHVTKLHLGKTGRIPIAHGRGINPHFVQGFIEACAEGLGIVEVRTLKSIAPMLKWDRL